MAKGNKSNGNDSGLNFEAPLWAAANKMRGRMDASDVARASAPAGSGGVLAASANAARGRPANPQPETAALCDFVEACA